MAIEEKFYFLWPLVAFILPLRWRTRLWTASVLLAMSTVTGVIWGTPGYFGIYVPIIAGCLIAILTGDEQGFRAAMVFARPAIGWTLVVGIVALILVAPAGPTQVAVGLAVAAALPFLLIAGGSASRALSGRLIQWAGRRA